MDLVLEYCDEYAFDAAYAYLFPAPSSTSPSPSSNGTLSSFSSAGASRLARDAIPRQLASLFVIALAAAMVLYFIFCSLSYYLVYDRRLEHHPKFLKNQVRQEIISSMIAAPVIDIMTLPWFLGEVRGHSKLYDNVADMGWAYFVFSAVWFLVFTDFLIYWIHRIEVSSARARAIARGRGRVRASMSRQAQPETPLQHTHSHQHHKLIYKYVHKPHHKWIVPTPYAALAFHPVDGYAQSLPYQ